MDNSRKHDLLIPELYFLLQKFLSASPLQETVKVLSQELVNKKILPIRFDWEGNKHERTFEDLERLYPHIGANHLLDICSRIGPILDREIPPWVKGVRSLLGSGRQSLLRTFDSSNTPPATNDYAIRRYGMPLFNPSNQRIHNFCHILAGREISGPVTRSLALPPTRYGQMQLQVQTLGHLSAVYCLLFDKTGRYIITGADDLLIKLWAAYTGRLLATFRGASAELTDIDISVENSLLAAGSIDRILRIWDLQTGAPMAILTGHTGTITSVHFCPSANYGLRYIATTSSDGSVAFWSYIHDARHRVRFIPKPTMYQEKMRPGQSQMICSSFSPGGSFMAAGSADHYVRVYLMRSDEGPIRILETEGHTDRVDSIAWAHRRLRFVSGSKDGTACIWHFERQQWKSTKLSMETKLPGMASTEQEQQDPKKLLVTMVAWDYSDDFIITASSDNWLRVWRSETGTLERILTGHTDGVFVLESHPKDPYVILSTGHDGEVFIWDVLRGIKVANFTNNLDNGQGRGSVFDAKWSPDGSMFATTDSHGHVMIYSFGTDNLYKMLPKEMFFHTDYRPLVRDADFSVLDEQTQVPPHLMPPPFLVDIDGNPYPPMLQRLVPGREHCTSEQLVPNIVISTSGRQEVIQGLPEPEPRSDIDRMIAALAQRQYGNEEAEGQRNPHAASPRSLGSRRPGDSNSVEGVRQSTGEWQRDSNFVWSKKLLIQPLTRYELGIAHGLVESTANFEMADYHREIKKRPLMISTATTSSPSTEKGRSRRRKNGNVNTRRTRRSNPSPREDHEDMEQDDPEPEESNNSSSSNTDDSSASGKEDDLSLSDSSSDTEESSGYSDWVAEQGVNLEPPKRSKRKSAHRNMLIDRQHIKDDESAPNCTKPKKIPMSKIKHGEIPEMYKQLEWLSETVPRKAPYCPQMGDEVVYFVQGHQLYVEAVRKKKIYNINNRDLPWMKRTLRDKEFVKIVGIKYIIRPPRLCCLKLALLDEQHNKLTDNDFTIKYHDMPDVLDCLVLRQTYETALARQWTVGDRFRCMIDDCWWIGKIEAKTDYNEEFPDSPFMCFEIQWDNGEKERMCHWDLEPICESRLPETDGDAVPVLPEEIKAILYQPSVDEWPRGDRDAACRRIICGLDVVMSLAIAEPFLAPVDLNMYPTYAFIVEFPIDLSTIKARFENHFYRRIAAAQFDVRYLATNAEQFNEPHSIIVKWARIITELCLRIIKCTEEIDVQAVYHQLMDTYTTSDSDDDNDEVQPGPSRPSTSRPLKARNLRSSNCDWRIEAKRLLDTFCKLPDSVPFRVPVDHIKHPEYYQLIDTPMDLATVREDLFGGNYETPNDFAKDMRLIFTNSKNFNTNKRSQIYAMTVRLSALFEEHIKVLISQWKRSKSRSTASTTRKSGRKRALKARSDAAASASDNSEKENRCRRNNRRENISRTNNKYDLPSTSKGPDLTTTEEEEEEDDTAMLAVMNTPTKRTVINKKPIVSDNDENDDDDEDFRVENGANNAQSSRTHVSIAEREEAEDEPIVENNKLKSTKLMEDDDSDDESDYEPLSKYANSSNHKRKMLASSETHSSETSESSSSDSDSGIKKNLRPRKRRKMPVVDDDDEEDESDSDNLPLKRFERQDSEDSGESDHVLSVSSRGRVRKMTEKARTMWKK